MSTTQAQRVIAAFGGAKKLSELFTLVGEKTRQPCGIYRWNMAKGRGGTGGVVPSSAWPDLFSAAKVAGIEITPELLDPRVIDES